MPIIGVNTFLSSKGSPTVLPGEVIRSTEEEKQFQIAKVEQQHAYFGEKRAHLLNDLQQAAIENRNMFEGLMEVSKVCTLGEITESLFSVGGQYRRNM
jgi:methylmalonyl-CoA mutase